MIQDYIKTEQGYTYEYPRAAMTTDSVIFGFDGKGLQILLVQRGIDPFKGSWALPGGFLRMDETIEECAKRELFEEAGLIVKELELFGIYSGKETHYIYPNGDEVSNVDIVYLCKEYEGELIHIGHISIYIKQDYENAELYVNIDKNNKIDLIINNSYLIINNNIIITKLFYTIL